MIIDLKNHGFKNALISSDAVSIFVNLLLTTGFPIFFHHQYIILL